MTKSIVAALFFIITVTDADTTISKIPFYFIASFGAVLLFVAMGTCFGVIVLVLSRRKRRLKRIFIHVRHKIQVHNLLDVNFVFTG